MSRGLASLLGCIAALWATAALAQDTQLAPSEALACLTPPLAERGVPVYPPDELERRDEGTVRVELVFSAPDAPPQVTVADDLSASFSSMRAAVRAHVAKLRVPCMVPGRPVTLRQTYRFIAGDKRKVVGEPITDPAQLVRAQLLACVTHVQDVARAPYPRSALSAGLEGKVFVRLRFDKPDVRPEVERLSPRVQDALTRSVDMHVRDLRMPCLQQEPITVTQIYAFRLEGGARARFNPMSLVELLQAAEHVPRPIFLDLNTMGCPFELRLRYLQPHMQNGLYQFEPANPARAPLLEWLSQIRLDLPRGSDNLLIGEETSVSIPCGTVDL